MEGIEKWVALNVCPKCCGCWVGGYPTGCPFAQSMYARVRSGVEFPDRRTVDDERRQSFLQAGLMNPAHAAACAADHRIELYEEDPQRESASG